MHLVLRHSQKSPVYADLQKEEENYRKIVLFREQKRVAWEVP